MKTFIITLLFALALVLICFAFLGIGKLLTGKSKFRCKRCSPSQKEKGSCDNCSSKSKKED